MNKSYVSVGQYICQVCGNKYDSEEVLLDRHLRNTLETHTVTGIGICPEDEEKFKQGYLACIEINNPETGDMIQAKDANRTGRIFHVRKTVFEDMINTKVPENYHMVFITPAVGNYLQNLLANSTTSENTSSSSE